MVTSFINESFELTQSNKVAQHFAREQEMKEQKSKLVDTIKKMKEDAGIADHFAAEEKQNLKLVRAYRKKEADLNSNISNFLVQRYGHNAEAPPIGDKKELIMQQNLTKKQRDE